MLKCQARCHFDGIGQGKIAYDDEWAGKKAVVHAGNKLEGSYCILSLLLIMT